ncbi:cobalamin biosynthesis protein CobT [Rhizobium azibense]|nr:cobalamin biosynthesis protein CobT [Rhizobium azibense]
MNNDIVILREAIKKIIPMLAGKGLTVTQMGTQAYVQPHPVTGLPYRVNIPLLPDNAEPDFVFAIQGFIDHEVAHVLFTDFLYKAHEKSRRLHNLHNIVEDTMIERLMGNEFPGSKKNISRLGKYFLQNVTAVAIAKAQSKQDEFDYLLVVLMRALAGHAEFQEFMDDNNYWDHELVKEFMKRFSKASQKKMPLLASTEETYEIALEVEAILYPPPPPAPPQPEPEEQDEDDSQGEGSDDQEESDGEDDKDHSDEEQTGDGEGDGEREHTEDNDNASGGEGESDEEEKEEDAGDGENEGSGEGEEKADDENNGDDDDTAGESADGSDDDQAGEEDAGDADGKGSDEADDQEGAADDADDQNGAGDGNDDDQDEGDTSDGEPADAGQEAENSDAEGEGEPAEMEDSADESGEPDQAGDDESNGDAGSSDPDDESQEGEEANGSPDLSNVAIEDTGDHDDDGDTDGEGEDGENDLEVAGIGYDPNQNPFSEMNDDALEEKDLSSALVKIIVKEAIEACRAADYSVFTREYDVIKTLDVPENFDSKHIVELDEQTRALTGVMQKDIERMMAAQSRVFNVAGQRSGRLNSSGLHRLTAGDPRVFSRREEIRAKDTAVALLSDCSGSMSKKPMATAMSASYALAQVLERCNIPAECMGFTTAQMYGDDGPLNAARIRQFNADLQNEVNKSRVKFSRVYPIYMPIFKEFHERINAEVKKRFAYQRKFQPFMGGNIDGESLEYAAMRLAKRKEKRKVIIVLSDGFPAGADGDDEHLKYMVERLTKMGFDLVGIGIESSAVARFYDNYLILNSVDELPKAVMGELKKILMK